MGAGGAESRGGRGEIVYSCKVLCGELFAALWSEALSANFFR
jgi:hypothetical protein